MTAQLHYDRIFNDRRSENSCVITPYLVFASQPSTRCLFRSGTLAISHAFRRQMMIRPGTPVGCLTAVLSFNFRLNVCPMM